MMKVSLSTTSGTAPTFNFMLASELIEKLKEAVAAHGDVTVAVGDVSGNVDIDEVKVRLIEPRAPNGKRLYSVKKVLIS